MNARNTRIAMITAAALSASAAGAAAFVTMPRHAESADRVADKHDCKGKNACKGQGGCKTDTHACKGQNACKGQGGCKG